MRLVNVFASAICLLHKAALPCPGLAWLFLLAAKQKKEIRMLLSCKSSSFEEGLCVVSSSIWCVCGVLAQPELVVQRFCRGSSGHAAELTARLQNNSTCSNENPIKTRQQPQDSCYKLFNYSSWMASEMRSFLPIWGSYGEELFVRLKQFTTKHPKQTLLLELEPQTV